MPGYCMLSNRRCKGAFINRTEERDDLKMRLLFPRRIGQTQTIAPWNTRGSHTEAPQEGSLWPASVELGQ
jgi:hypothetical protein